MKDSGDTAHVAQRIVLRMSCRRKMVSKIGKWAERGVRLAFVPHFSLKQRGTETLQTGYPEKSGGRLRGFTGLRPSPE